MRTTSPWAWAAAALLALFSIAADGQQTPYSCPNCDLDGTDFTTKGYNLVKANLAGASLQNTNFTGLDLTTAELSGADLTSANLSNANLTSADLSSSTLVLTNLTGATLASTNLEFADLACTNFANIDVTTTDFGPVISFTTSPSCLGRVSFAGATMGCGFIAQWNLLDLTGANISACWSNLSGVDFSNAIMPGVTFTNGSATSPTDLSNTTWNGANLTGASFNSGYLLNADFSGSATSPGAILTNADLTYVNAQNGKFDYANLGNNPNATPPQPGARAAFGYFAGASFTYANLQFADFSYASLTGVSTEILTGASISGATFIGTNLAGLDLSQVSSGWALGVQFSNANLANTNLKNVDFSPNLFTGCGGVATVIPSSFTGAFMCGTTIDSTTLNGANLTGAYMPTTDIKLPGPDGTSTDCPAMTLTSPITNGIPSNGLGTFTTCPDGTPGPCQTANWTAGGVPTSPCCTASSSSTPCPNRKRSGFACTTNCDCTSYECTNGLCQ